MRLLHSQSTPTTGSIECQWNIKDQRGRSRKSIWQLGTNFNSVSHSQHLLPFICSLISRIHESIHTYILFMGRWWGFYFKASKGKVWMKRMVNRGRGPPLRCNLMTICGPEWLQCSFRLSGWVRTTDWPRVRVNSATVASWALRQYSEPPTFYFTLWKHICSRKSPPSNYSWEQPLQIKVQTKLSGHFPEHL